MIHVNIILVCKVKHYYLKMSMSNISTINYLIIDYAIFCFIS